MCPRHLPSPTQHLLQWSITWNGHLPTPAEQLLQRSDTCTQPLPAPTMQQLQRSRMRLIAQVMRKSWTESAPDSRPTVLDEDCAVVLWACKGSPAVAAVVGFTRSRVASTLKGFWPLTDRRAHSGRGSAGERLLNQRHTLTDVCQFPHLLTLRHGLSV